MDEPVLPWQGKPSTRIDVRQACEQGGEPFLLILEAASRIKSGETLIVVAPFEPIPVYAVLAAQGFIYQKEKVANDEWIVSFSHSV